MGDIWSTRVSKSFEVEGESLLVLDDIDLHIEDGEFVVLIGPSGSGKSTLLNIFAGLLSADTGGVTLDDEPIEGPGPDRGVVFQQHVLLPWMTARQNVRFAVDCVANGLTAEERDERVDHYLRLVHLSDAGEKRPDQLSGGMQQRVGIARALAIEPEVLLLDEPFGALDALTRLSLQDELLEIWEADKRTVVLVTHDVDEALLLADRIVVLSHGPGARILHDHRVPFSRPRDRDSVARESDYLDMRGELIRSLTAPAVTV